MNTKTSNWMRRLAGITTLLMVFTSFVGQASARILFQDDTVGAWESDSMNIGSNDAGGVNTSIKFGADGTASENGNITWNIGTNSFSVDHTVDVTGGLSATGQVNFSGAAGMRLREDATPNTTAACGVLDEVIVNTTTHKLMVCTTTGIAGIAVWTAPSPAVPTGGPGNPGTCAVGDLFFNTTLATLQVCTAVNTWNVAGPQDFEAVFNYDADKTLTTGNTAFSIATGSGALNLDTGASTGAVSIGGGSGTLAINTTSWDISSAGVATGFTGITSTGDVNFSQADSTRIQESTDPVTLVGCSFLGELILDTTDNEIQVCTATGSNAVAATLADQTVTYTAKTPGTSGNAITLTVAVSSADNGGNAATATVNHLGNAITLTIVNDTDAGNGGVGAETIGQVGVRNCLNQAVTNAALAGTGASAGNSTFACTITNAVTTLIAASGGTAATDEVALGATPLASGLNGTATWTATAAGNANTLDGIDSTQFLRSDTNDAYTSGTLTFNNGTFLTLANGSTLGVNGVATIGDGGDTVAINSSDWGIDTTGVVTGIASIAANDNQATLNTNIGVTGADVALHTLAFQIDGNTGISIAATGNGAGLVGPNTVTIGASAAADTVTIGDANATVGISSATWNISGPGAASGLTTVNASSNFTTSGGTFCVGTTCLNETNAVGDNGATLVGAFDEFTNSNSTNVQDVLDDLDALIGSNAPNTEVLTFYPEYPDAVIWADGLTNNGTLISDYDNANSEHYYDWTSTRAATQDMDIKFRFPLPADFVSTGDFTYRYRTGSGVQADNNIEMYVTDITDAGAACGNDTSNTNAGAWATGTILAATLNGGCAGLSAGDIIEVDVKFFDNSGAADYADVGYLSLAYNN